MSKLIFLTGGSGCGKSTYAERILAEQGGTRVYLATMRSDGEDSRERILRHQKQREHIGFLTIEKETDLGEIALPERTSLLLECVATWLDNEWFYAGKSPEKAVQSMLRSLDVLRGKCDLLVAVSNEVGAEGGPYDPDTEHYVDVLAELNRAVAAKADTVIEMVSGLPILLKGEKLPLRSAKAGKKEGANTMINLPKQGLMLVVGPKGAGKLDFIKGLGFGEDEIADGVLEDKAALFGLERLLLSEPGIKAFDLVDKRVITVAEVGSGIIPAEREMRQWREKVGRLTNELARKAVVVVRLVAGIPYVLKREPD